ncbi:TauD/TfdA family dioxygenase [Novosphingobium sp. BL-8H]|uniref:TauD/TfdA dioxygenase family protein n=1 Tax=Novosphingobium sp. BL-8H TaxID=3127640 RepID=UPI0037581E2F
MAFASGTPEAGAIQAVDLTPRIASRIMIDKPALLSGTHAEEIRSLLIARGVVVVRDIALDDDELRTIARTLGQLRIGAVRRGADGAILTEGDGGILRVTLDETRNPEYARFLFGNQLWHMDGTYEEVPPFATLLAPVRLSARGGDTLFANTAAAFADLPEDEQRRLETLRVLHTMQAALFPAKRDCSVEEFALWSSYPQRSHPLVWQHRSGVRSLVLSTSGAYVEGMEPAESHDLLQRLMIHATQDRYVYRHKWQPGDLAIWDNTATMHRVEPFDRESGRELHRCTLNGEEPVTAPA